jgi:putative cardiolipin synthase
MAWPACGSSRLQVQRAKAPRVPYPVLFTQPSRHAPGRVKILNMLSISLSSNGRNYLRTRPRPGTNKSADAVQSVTRMVRGRLLVGLVALLLGACSSLPSLQGRTQTHALTETANTPIGRAVAERLHSHPGQSGVHALQDPQAAFAARMQLAHDAQRSLDVQTYIWHGDLTGTLLFKAVRDAADRGVRVRLLLDDNNTVGLDPRLAALDAQSNIEVRLFNPFVIRNARWLGYLTDFSRLNRRMHNKSFTADNQATIVGGRNIGDEYFGATNGVLFADLDVLAIGPIVDRVSRDFDQYWASASAYPAARLLPPASAAEQRAQHDDAVRIAGSRAAAVYLDAVKRSAFMAGLKSGSLDVQWTDITMIADDPAKALGQADPRSLFPTRLVAAMGRPEHTLDMVSPYFVPGADGVAQLGELAHEGVRVRALTNSLAATDVAAVHAGYAKRRKALLQDGVQLFELRPEAPQSASGDTPEREFSASMKASAGSGSGGSHGLEGSSGASLHAKTFAVDDRRVFIGSFNFDPRSSALNTELGFVFDSRALALRIAHTFDTDMLLHAYEVQLDPASGSLVWITRDKGPPFKTEVHHTEPGTVLWKRLWIRFLSVLPIEWLL